MKRMGRMRRFHSDTVFFFVLVTSVTLIISLVILVNAGSRVSADCDEHGNLVYNNADELFVIEGAEACATRN